MLSPRDPTPRDPRWVVLTALAALVGAVLIIDAAWRTSATYDEVAYLQIGTEWWRGGPQERIARMGSPLTFWKLQQAPVLWLVDRLDHRDWIDEPIANQTRLLPLLRIGATWIWLAAFGITVAWARRAHGPRAMALAGWLFALSPNLLAHAALITMELPLVACAAGMAALFARFLATGRLRWFWATAALGGLAFSCKFTAILLPPMFALAWWLERRRMGDPPLRAACRVIVAMIGFGLVMALANVAVTGAALVPISENRGAHPSLDAGRLGSLARPLVETPIPQDWAAFIRQMQHQRSGGPSYLFGERRMTGWWYYYFVCIAVKVPIPALALLALRAFLKRRITATPDDRLAVILMAGTLVLVAMGSSRNYGFRYLLFLAPAAIVWTSAMANTNAWVRRLAWLGVLAQGVAVAAIHPAELAYFNAFAGGPEGGKFILADSNLDWGQGARAMARLQSRRPELRDVTLYYFGDTNPAYYGVHGTIITIDAHQAEAASPRLEDLKTAYVAVSRSLQYGPWGPPRAFAALDHETPIAVTDDHTIAVYALARLKARERRDQ